MPNVLQRPIMADLATLQRALQHYLESGNETIAKHIVNTEDARAEHRLAAYYNAYRARLIEALAFDFPSVQAFLGDDEFAYLVIAYIKKYPSSYPSVRWVGKNFANYIKQQKELKQQGFLAELALFEWSQSLVFDSTNPVNIFQLDDMVYAPEQWAELIFKFTPNLQKINLNYNVVQYWQAVEDKNKRPNVLKNEHPVQWLLWRKNLDPYWRSLEVHEAWALQQAQDGANFGIICEGLIEWVDAEHVATVAAGFLKQWISDQLLVDVTPTS